VNILKKKISKRIRDFCILVIFILLSWLALFGYKYQFIYMSGISMEPTIYDNEWLVVQNRSTLGKGWTPDRLDLVLIKDKEAGDLLTKRVIGLPGETVEIKEGEIYLNDKLFKDPYGRGLISFFLVDDNDKNLIYWNGPDKGKPVVSLVNQVKKTIPNGSVWIIGDNRAESWYGVLEIKEIKSLVIY
jgi:signal peptidase I